MATAKNSNAETEEGSLVDFSFDGENEFFGIKPDTLGTDKVMKQIKSARAGDDDEDDDDDGTPTNLEDDSKDEKEKKPTGKIPEKEDKKDKNKDKVEFFKEEEEEKKKSPESNKKDSKKIEEKEEEEEEDLDDDNEIEEKDDTKFYSTLAEELKEKGVFANIELPKDGNVTEEQFFELQDQEIEARVDETFEAFFKDMDEEGKDFLKFKKNGGNTRTFIQQYGSTLGIEDFDEDSPVQIDKVINHYLRTYEKLEDDEEFEDRRKYIKDGGKEKAIAIRYFKTIQKDDTDRKAAILKIQEQAADNRVNNIKEFNNSIREVILSTDKIGNFNINKTEQKDLDTYITKPIIKVEKNKYVPAFQNDLAKILKAADEKEKKNLILLAKLIRDKFEIKDLVIKTETKVAKRVRSRLEMAKNSTKISSSGRSSRKALADYIDE